MRTTGQRLRLGIAVLAILWIIVSRPFLFAQAAIVANAGPDQTAYVGATVTLDGSASTGPITQYTWTFVSRPSGSQATLTNPASLRPTFVPDRRGTYVVRLTVGNGTVTSRDTVSVTMVNRPPVANAGSNVSLAVGQRDGLDGRLSSDVDNDRLTYVWTVTGAPSNSRRALASPTAARPTLTLDRPGTYIVELVVSDGLVSSPPDEVVITTLNTRPVADAGPDQRVTVGATVTLDGAGSYDVDEQTLTFAWTLRRPGASAAILSDPQAVRPSLVPDVAGTYVATLTVSDGTETRTDTVTLTTANVRPVGRAEPGGTELAPGMTVQFDGTGSSDVNGDRLSYQWTLTAPTGSLATLSDPTSPRPTLTADVAGRYSAALVVRDGTLASPSVATVFAVANKAPTADAGRDQGVAAGAEVQLDGAGSTDPEGDELGYGWAFTSKPEGSAATLSSTGDVRPTFVADRPGTYALQLIVFDGRLLGAGDTVVITVGNVPPIAAAAPDQAVGVGTTVALDGTGSFDANSDALAFRWALTTRPAGSAAVLSYADTGTPAFTVDVAGDYVAQLVVSDAKAVSESDTVLVTTRNARPTANAGADPTGPIGNLVTLDGNASSDANGDPLTYSWALLARPLGSAAALADAGGPAPTFTPDRPGVYVAQLVVRDAVITSRADTVAFTAGATVNRRPVASATVRGVGKVTTATTVQLDGSGSSDPDGDPLTYRWTFVSLPEGSTASLTGATTAAPAFVPDQLGRYEAELVVNDGALDSLPARVTVDAVNGPPVAIIRAPGNACPTTSTASILVSAPPPPPRPVTLDGSCSKDPNPADTLTYHWIFNTWPGQFADPRAPQPVLAPAPDAATVTFQAGADGDYTLQLVVNDGIVNSPSAIVRIKTSNAVPNPVNAGPDQTNVAAGATIALSGTASDPDTDTLTYTWSFVQRPEGSAAVLTNPNTLTPTFVVDVLGRYEVRFAASDGFLEGADTVVISTANRPPTANAGNDQVTTVNLPVTVSGTGSDPDGDPLAYAWTFVSRPPGSAVTLGAPSGASLTFTPDLPGDYTFRLVVNDGQYDSSPDDVVVHANNGRIALSLHQDGPLGVGRTSPLRVVLTAPAPGGGVEVSLSSDDLAIAKVGPAMVAIPGGGTTAVATVTGVAVGSTTLRASSVPFIYEAGFTGVSVTTELITLGSGVSAPVGVVSAIPVSIGPNPAPPGGVVVTMSTPDVSVLELIDTSVTIPADMFSGTARVRGVAGGTATVVAQNPSYATATTTVTSTGDLRILESSPVSLSPALTRTIHVQLESGGQALIAPVDLGVKLTAADPTCVSVANATIKAGMSVAEQTLMAAVGASPPCSTTVTASGVMDELTPGSVAVNVAPSPTLTMLPPGPLSSFPRYVGSGLQDGPYTVQLGTTVHSPIRLELRSNDPGRLWVSPDATAGGSDVITLDLPDGQSTRTFYVQGREAPNGDPTVTGDATIDASARVAAGASTFARVTSGTISVVPPGVSMEDCSPALPGTAATLASDVPFAACVGPARSDGSGLFSQPGAGPLQAVRAGGFGRTATVASSAPSVGRIVTVAGTATTALVDIAPGSAQSAPTVSLGGAAFHAQGGGTATVSATIPGFVATTTASRTVTVTAPGITLYSPNPYPAYRDFPRYVGAGLQDGPCWVKLGATNHPGVRVRIESSDPAKMLVSANAATPADLDHPWYIEVPVDPGLSDAPFYLQGVEGQIGSVRANVSAEGFSPTSAAIEIVRPGVSLLSTLPAATTSLSADVEFTVSLGPALPDGSNLRNQTGTGTQQALRVGGGSRDVTVRSTNAAIADVKTKFGGGGPCVPPGATDHCVSVTLPEGSSRTSATVAAGGVALDPQAQGETTVSASLDLPNAVTTVAATRTVTVTAPSLTFYSPYSQPAYQNFPRVVGSGLQEGPYWVRLGASDHPRLTLRIASSNPARVRVSKDDTTPGADSIGVDVDRGASVDIPFYVQGMDELGDVTLEASAPGFVDATGGVVSVVPSGLTFHNSLAATTTALAADSPFIVYLGPVLPDGSDLRTQDGGVAYQAVRAGEPLTLTVASSNPAVGQIRNKAGSAAFVTVPVLGGKRQTGSSLATEGVAFDPVSGGTTVVTASIPGFQTTAAANRTVTVTAAGMAIYSPSPYNYPALQAFPQYVGAGLQDGRYWVRLDGANHGGVTLRIASANSGLALVAPDAGTAGTAFFEVAVPNGVTDVPFYVQGIENAVGSVTITAAAPGFTGTTSGIINIVVPAVALLNSLSASQWTLQPDQPFYAYLGVPADDLSTLRTDTRGYVVQAVRFGGVARTVRLLSSDVSAGGVVATGQIGGDVTVTIQPTESRTGPSIATRGVAFRAVAPGRTTVSASVDGFVTVARASVDVTVAAAPIGVYSPSSSPGSLEQRYIGAGLQDGPFWIRLGGTAHGGRMIRIASSDSTRALISRDAVTPPTPPPPDVPDPTYVSYIEVTIPDGQTDRSFFVQGLEGQTGPVTVVAMDVTDPAPPQGFADGSRTITITPPAYRLTGLPASVAATGATVAFRVQLGAPTSDNSNLLNQGYTGQGQALRAGGPVPLTGLPVGVAIRQDSGSSGAQLLISSGGSSSWTLAILPRQAATPASVEAGGIAFDPLSGSCTPIGCGVFVEANVLDAGLLPDLVRTGQATELVQVTP